MKEHPILFSAEMVRAIVERRKTVTRRVIRPQPPSVEDVKARAGIGYHWSDAGRPDLGIRPMGPVWAVRELGGKEILTCPYGNPGDHLVPLCTWAVHRDHEAMKPTDLPHDVSIWSWWESEEKPSWCGRSRPGRFMPKFLRGWLPRLEVVGVRVERLQDITVADICAEGFHLRRKLRPRWTQEEYTEKLPRLFAAGWDELNAKRGFGWDTNCWVWVVTFKPIVDNEVAGV